MKLREYQRVPSILTYVIVQSEACAITVLSRGEAGDRFRATGLAGDKILELPEIGISVPVAELYDDVMVDMPRL